MAGKTRRIRKAAAVVCLLCAWVLWYRFTLTYGLHIPPSVFETRQTCEVEREKLIIKTKANPKFKGVTIIYACLPAGLNPNDGA